MLIARITKRRYRQADCGETPIPINLYHQWRYSFRSAQLWHLYRLALGISFSTTSIWHTARSCSPATSAFLARRRPAHALQVFSCFLRQMYVSPLLCFPFPCLPRPLFSSSTSQSHHHYHFRFLPAQFHRGDSSPARPLAIRIFVFLMYRLLSGYA